MIEALLMSLTGPQIIFLMAMTVAGGFIIGMTCFYPEQVWVGFGFVIFLQVLLFWTSAHLDTMLYAFESGIANFGLIPYIGLHHGVQIGTLWLSFVLGRSFALRNSR